ncbi:GNAT family N-acetyltransferase [Leifsonia sp. YAF41]|uniref:GNAT family N-acetyltransferase n=1 Tax=Leifsonia sp. YAF41 TaxID=3233086 RepID=UPI003F94BAE3
MTGLDIEGVRAEIDALDRQIVQLIAERQRWVVEAGALKPDQDAVRAPDRVEKVVDKVRALANEAAASPEVVERTYRAMIAAFIDLELSIHGNHVASAAGSAPGDTERLHFRPMTLGDLENMAALLGDPDVMTYYPAPKTRDEARAWIEWNQRNYAEHGFGLWIIETRDGEFVGDCGLTWQQVNGRRELEVGYHVRAALQGRGYATEAAAACRDFARDVLGTAHLVAIIHPDNAASVRIAKKIGMSFIEEDHGREIVRRVLGLDFSETH